MILKWRSRLSPVIAGLLAACAGCAPPADAPPARPPAVTIKAPPPGATEPASSVDEGDPSTQVARLKEPALRAPALKRLTQMFEDAMTSDGGDRDGAHVRPLLDRIVEPLAQTCAAGGLDPKARSLAVKLLADARDPRAAPCFIAILKEYQPEREGEEDVQTALRAVGRMRLAAAASPLLEMFTRMRASRLRVQGLYRDAADAIVTLAEDAPAALAAWEPRLIALLERPIEDPKDLNVLKDELVWQTTAAQALGVLKSEKAIRPLLKVVLSPSKADAHMTAIFALLKIGKPAINEASLLLKGSPAELVAYGRAEEQRAAAGGGYDLVPGSQPHVRVAALALGSIGRGEAAPILLSALAKAGDADRAIIARELVKLPSSPAIQSAFRATLEKTPIPLTIPPGMGARVSLIQTSADFFDASMTTFLVKAALAMKGDEDDRVPVAEASLIAAVKLMTATQITSVKPLYEMRVPGFDGKPRALGQAIEKEFAAAKELVTACRSDVDCYLRAMSAPTSQEKEGHFREIKAAYMVGIYGAPEVKPKIVDLLPKIKNQVARYVALRVIEHLSPKGDPATAAKLQAIVDDAEIRRDTQIIAMNASFKGIIYRLRARDR